MPILPTRNPNVVAHLKTKVKRTYKVSKLSLPFWKNLNLDIINGRGILAS
jgi:hypothetical protein